MMTLDSKYGLENADYIRKSYLSGKSLLKLGEEFNCSHECLRRFLKMDNIFISKSLNYTINKNFFNKIDTEEKAYILGFIYADGNLEKDGYRVSMKISKKDIDVLEKIQTCLETNIPIKTIGQKESYIIEEGIKKHFISKPIAEFRCSIKEMYNDLILLGLHPNKSLTNIIPKEFIYNKDFWRGMIDGDGCLYLKNNILQLTLVGTEDVCYKFLQFCLSFRQDIRSKVKKQNKIFSITITSSKAERILDELYQNSTIYMNRKYEKYLFIKNNYKPNSRYIELNN